jgi:isoleucyl-tRNA synthetase
LKNVIIPLWNSYSFFVTYASIDGASPSAAPDRPANPLDRWILSEAARLVEETTRQLDAYDLQKAIDPIVEFIDLTNNWYIRRSRRRFWRSENDSDKAQAYQTLYAVLLTLVKVAAPIIPFITEEIYRNLRTADMPESVHLCPFPAYEATRRDLGLEREMALARRAVSLGRALRTMHNLKIRQPLKALHLVTRDPAEKAVLAAMRELIREEINVKEVVLRDNEEELVEYAAKANFKVLGKTLGKDMKEAAARIEKLGGGDIRTLLAGGTVDLAVADRSIPLSADGILVTRTEKEHLKVLNEGSLTVALDPELTPELVREGLVRDLVRGVQNLRKERGLAVTDRIELEISGSEELRRAVEAFQERLTGETLADGWLWRRHPDAAKVECGQEIAYVHLRKR